MEGAEKVCHDDPEEFWIGKEEHRASHPGRSSPPCRGHERGERWAFHRTVWEAVALSFIEQILPKCLSAWLGLCTVLSTEDRAVNM